MKAILQIPLLALACGLLASCSRPDPGLVQGYVEGEFVYVAAPFAGPLTTLSVERGANVEKGAALFALDDTTRRAARDQAARNVAQARAELDDARTGLRPTEIDSIRARLSTATAALELSETELARQKELLESKVASRQEYDLAHSQRDQARGQVDQLTADLATARLGARTTQITAAEETLKSREAALVAAEWDLAHMAPSAPQTAQVSDVLYRPGDWVAAGAPVVELLPPGNVRVRAFIGQAIFGRVHVGDTARVFVDGTSSAVEGRVAFVSPRAEYTPPVIYSQQMREKFVYLVELVFAPEAAAGLHPGQPVDVRFSVAAP